MIKERNNLVSVILCAYNAEHYIADSIRSILAQTLENWELIIVDDCSTDSTYRIAQQLSDKDPRIRLLHNEENAGAYLSANIGLKHAKGEFVARLDADDISEPFRLEKQVDFLNAHPDIVLVGSGGYQLDDSGKRVRKINAISRDWIIKRLMTRLNLFIHSSILARRNAFEDVGGYREKFIYVADYDLCLRLSEKHRISNIPDHLTGWRTSASSITMKNHIMQRICADIAREFALERKQKGYDSYASTNFDEKIQEMLKGNYGRYLCDYGIYKAFFCKQYRDGIVELLKGIGRGGIPHNAIMRGIVQVLGKI